MMGELAPGREIRKERKTQKVRWREGSKIMNGTEGRRSEIRLMKERT